MRPVGKRDKVRKLFLGIKGSGADSRHFGVFDKHGFDTLMNIWKLCNFDQSYFDGACLTDAMLWCCIICCCPEQKIEIHSGPDLWSGVGGEDDSPQMQNNLVIHLGIPHGLLPDCPLRAQEHPANPAPQASAALPGSTSGQYADTEICKTCHEEVWDKHFAGTPHSALLKGDQHGCQGCHGPAQAHVDGGGDVTKIIRFETLSPAQTAAICTKCHQSSLETQNFSNSEHLANGVSCTHLSQPTRCRPTSISCWRSRRLPCATAAMPRRRRNSRGLTGIASMSDSSSAVTATIPTAPRPVTRFEPQPVSSRSAPSATPTPWGRSFSSTLR